MTPTTARPLKTRRLSPWRVTLAVLIVFVAATFGIMSLQQWRTDATATSNEPWFASYVDVTSTPTFAFDQMGATNSRDAVLSFIVSSPQESCTPTWGSAYTLDQAGGALDLDRRIARLQQQGGSVAISFGGLNNRELALDCSDPAKLLTAYRTVVDRYGINTIDLDLENDGLKDAAAGSRRATAIAALQRERKAAGKPLAVWVTLPVAPQGLTEDGTSGVSRLLAGNVDLAGVNVMTMDYGNSKTEDMSMQVAAENALTQTVRQLGIIYKQNNIELSNATLWSKIGATPMIGQNDVKNEVFSLADAKGLNTFAKTRNIGRMSMWSANRDVPCGSNYIELKVVSDSCSGVKESKGSFALALSDGFTGSLRLNAATETTSEIGATAVKSDDPATSPYQIWSETGAYLEDTKVVWHHNVYRAKWWTQNNTPDDPVLQSYQTPWELVGPVLPGEKPVTQPTVPDGTYPDWSGSDIYDTDQRVVFKGVPYKAKWWNQGQSPAASSSNANTSPWTPLTQAEINALTQ